MAAGDIAVEGAAGNVCTVRANRSRGTPYLTFLHTEMAPDLASAEMCCGEGTATDCGPGCGYRGLTVGSL